ncbi:MAG: MerC domain-containing protein [Balneolales bacterium]
MLHTNNRRKLFSNLSIVFSSVCVLHCMMTPFLILLLPALSEFFSETIELILVMAIVPLSLTGFLPNWIRHKNYFLLLLFISGLAIVILSQLYIHAPHDSLTMQSGIADNSTYLKSILMFIGAMILAFSVFKNNKHTHVCSHKH